MSLSRMSDREKQRQYVRFFTLVFGLCAVISLLLFPAFLNQAQAKPNPRYASIVMDSDTGLILHQHNADKLLYPASLVKMMTLLLTFDAFEKGTLKTRDRITISKHAASMIPSKLDLPVGSTMRVEDAIYALITKSANDVAVSLAERISGTEYRFVLMMNKKAKEIGLSRTHFKNASGLHHPQQISTARDIAKLSRYLIREYPQYYHYFSIREFTYRGKIYKNHNRMMRYYKGMDGLKTGYVRTSGFNLAASVQRQNHRIIGVVFGGRTTQSRDRHMANLLDRSFAKLDKIMMASASIPIPAKKPADPTRLSYFSQIEPASGKKTFPQCAKLAPVLQRKFFSMIIGEGDYDPDISKRFETGLLAISSLKEKGLDPAKIKKETINSKSERGNQKTRNRITKNKEWAIQVGAFKSRAKIDKVIKLAYAALPPDLKNIKPVIAPVKTPKGLLFRGRLAGMSKKEAQRACRILDECLPVLP